MAATDISPVLLRSRSRRLERSLALETRVGTSERGEILIYVGRIRGTPIVEPRRQSVKRLKESRVKDAGFQCHAGQWQSGRTYSASRQCPLPLSLSCSKKFFGL